MADAARGSGDAEGLPRDSEQAPAVGRIPCPDRNLLAGWAEGRLLEEEREIVEGHMADCAGCRAAAVGAYPPAPSSPRIPLRRLVPAAAAAILLLAVGILWPRPRPPVPGLERRLAVAAADLARRDPERLDGFLPIPPDELRRRSDPVRGTGLRAATPVGRLLDGRPEFRWFGGAAGEPANVALELPGGTVAWTAEARGDRLPFPASAAPLVPGKTYTWSVTRRGPLGPEEDRRAFSVLEESERGSFSTALASIDGAAPPDLASLLKAHLALRRDLPAEAERFARGAVAALPDEPLARWTLFQAVERQRDPAADGLFVEASQGDLRR